MDIALCLEQMGIPADCSPDISTYAALAANWRGDGDCPPEADFIAVWAVLELDILREQCLGNINTAMYTRLEQGIIWKYNNGGDPQTISIDESIQKLFSYTTTLRGKGRTNSHGGKFRQGATRFSIDDAGLEELSIFAAEWGFAIQRIAFNEIDLVEAMDAIQLAAYDASQIDWTIDWSLDPQNSGNGWDNDTVLQVP